MMFLRALLPWNVVVPRGGDPPPPQWGRREPRHDVFLRALLGGVVLEWTS
jgi:hypothetical protein